MSTKPENRFIKKVHEHLPDELFGEKTTNPYRAGIPDCYYESSTGIVMWVEYKFLASMPRKWVTLYNLEANAPKVTHLQANWLRRAYFNNVRTGVAVGFKVGRATHGVLIPGMEWYDRQIPAHLFETYRASAQDFGGVNLDAMDSYSRTRADWRKSLSGDHRT